ncbi:RNA-directed DNA polymerase from mobile element jockey [Trichonephila clavipes]|nr:RNA-directed DNA polymerase from mobile element jockey [Trichonephila clavipes]
MQRPVCYRDLKTSTQNYIHRVWQETWHQQILNKLHSIHPSTSHWAALPVRRHDVRLTRLRIGHTRFTHRHLLLGNWKVEDRARAEPLKPCLKEARAPCIAVEIEAIASEAASGTGSAREAARRLGLPPSSVRNILRRILQLYPYKCNHSCHELLPKDTAQRHGSEVHGLL